MVTARPRGTAFARVDRAALGYAPRQVDRFLARVPVEDTAGQGEAGGTGGGAGGSTGGVLASNEVRSIVFDPAKGGYDPRAVDADLDRLEDELAREERDRVIAARGADAWLRELEETVAALQRRLRRGPGKRFRRPAKERTRSYDVGDVDRLCEDVLQYLDHDAPLGVDDVRHAVFREARGADGYEENQVDAFLDRVIGLLKAIA